MPHAARTWQSLDDVTSAIVAWARVHLGTSVPGGFNCMHLSEDNSLVTCFGSANYDVTTNYCPPTSRDTFQNTSITRLKEQCHRPILKES